MTKERLIELGWRERCFKDHFYLYKDDLALINYAGIWVLGRVISGEPYIPLHHPVYVKNEEELRNLLQL